MPIKTRMTRRQKTRILRANLKTRSLRNYFAYLLFFIECDAFARKEFQWIGNLPDEVPWGFFEDPVERYVKCRKELLGA